VAQVDKRFRFMLESTPMARRFFFAGFFFYPCPLAEDNG
jgi:hypothetical protein